MAEQTTPSGAESVGGTLKSLGEQAMDAGRDVKDKAAGIAEASADKLKDQASEFANAAKDMAGQATDKLKETISDKKSPGADYVGSLAETIRRASREFDNDLPIAGKYIRKAASQVENVADSIRSGDFHDLMRNAQSFARRQPTAFLGIAAIAGFAAVRFLKSSPEAPAGESGKAPRGSSSNTGHRDEFSK